MSQKYCSFVVQLYVNPILLQNSKYLFFIVLLQYASLLGYLLDDKRVFLINYKYIQNILCTCGLYQTDVAISHNRSLELDRPRRRLVALYVTYISVLDFFCHATLLFLSMLPFSPKWLLRTRHHIYFQHKRR